MSFRRRALYFLLANLLVYSFLIIVLEISGRIYYGEWQESFLTRKINLMKRAYPVAHDQTLGWIPRPSYSTDDNVWGTQVTIDRQGFRTNGEPGERLREQAPEIIAFGDSFTFGDEVSDRETWVAYLEQLLNRRVLNAGVFGYGLDQIYLRARETLPNYQARVVVFSLIPEDISRCGFSEKSGVYKPFFRILDNDLVLENVPVPEPKEVEMDFFRRVFGHSWTVHSIMKKVKREYWYQGVWSSTLAHEEADSVAKLLIERCCAMASESGAVPVILLQYSGNLEGRDRMFRLTDELAGEGAVVLDTYDLLAGISRDDPERFGGLFEGHMTPEGNHLVADYLFTELPSLLEGLSP